MPEYIRISNMPNFESVARLLEVIRGIPNHSLTNMKNTIKNFGDNQEPPLDWSDPDMWLDNLQDGESKELAKKIWTESKHITNPRYLHTEIALINAYNLMDVRDNIYIVTEQGEEFLDVILENQHKSHNIILEIDRQEGVIPILSFLYRNGKSKSANVISDFENFLEDKTNKTPTNLYPYVRSRINNLVEREYIIRSGNFYNISPSGKDYLQKIDPQNIMKRHLDDAEKQQNEIRQKLKDHLHHMNANDFEKVITKLFRLMGYDNVEDLQATHDGGIDVVAQKDFGFGDEKVVIQVKRRSDKLNRDVISQLRDDTRTFKGATRGIVVTTSDFNKNAIERANESGEIPISLINGEMLIDLMIDHQLGIKQIEVVYYEFSTTDLSFTEELDEDSDIISENSDKLN